MKRKLLSIVLAGGMALSLIGCGQEEKNTFTIKDGDHKVTVTYTEDDEALQHLLIETDYDYYAPTGEVTSFNWIDIYAEDGISNDEGRYYSSYEYFNNDGKLAIKTTFASTNRLQWDTIHIDFGHYGIEGETAWDYETLDEAQFHHELKNSYSANISLTDIEAGLSFTDIEFELSEDRGADDFYPHGFYTTPLSITLYGFNTGENPTALTVESATLKDGSVIDLTKNTTYFLESNDLYLCYIVDLGWGTDEYIDGTQIASITINGQTFECKYWDEE